MFSAPRCSYHVAYSPGEVARRPLGIDEVSMQQPRNPRTSSELELLRTLIDRCDRSPPSQVEIEKGLESGLARLMSLEGRLRQKASRTGERPPPEQPPQDHDLVEEIRSLREAVAELRARANPGRWAPLAQGFVLRRNP